MVNNLREEKCELDLFLTMKVHMNINSLTQYMHIAGIEKQQTRLNKNGDKKLARFSLQSSLLLSESLYHGLEIIPHLLEDGGILRYHTVLTLIHPSPSSFLRSALCRVR